MKPKINWQHHVSTWKNSDLTQSDYSRANKLNRNTFSAWTRRLSGIKPIKKSNFIELPNSVKKEEKLSFTLEIGGDGEITLRIKPNTK